MTSNRNARVRRIASNPSRYCESNEPDRRVRVSHRVARAAPRTAQIIAPHQRRHPDRHDQITACSAPGSIAKFRSTSADDQNWSGPAPQFEPIPNERARGIAGQLGRQRDVRNLKEAVSTGREQEEDEHPQRTDSGAGRHGG